MWKNECENKWINHENNPFENNHVEKSKYECKWFMKITWKEINHLNQNPLHVKNILCQKSVRKPHKFNVWNHMIIHVWSSCDFSVSAVYCNLLLLTVRRRRNVIPLCSILYRRIWELSAWYWIWDWFKHLICHERILRVFFYFTCFPRIGIWNRFFDGLWCFPLKG